ncbi:hypothetical protein DPMN_109261 [Dreissena polymorpha]|uniref:Uncharacterized protein n=1 Tax=Dreissena polymorpha TaxID=45954 RepID=A0A9D4KAB3_DREPO|nr:hypothetical protein DPMN_109261 [Dreissena polymorpha]
MGGINIDKDMVQVMQELYGNANSSVLFNGRERDFFRTSVDGRNEYLLFLVLYNISLMKII